MAKINEEAEKLAELEVRVKMATMLLEVYAKVSEEMVENEKKYSEELAKGNANSLVEGMSLGRETVYRVVIERYNEILKVLKGDK